jgi:hypothetical protein
MKKHMNNRGNEVLPAPEKLDGTKSCEMAALLVTLNFTSVDDALTVAKGDGIPGGRLGYWRFLPQHPQGKYSLAAVLRRGLDPEQGGKVGTAAQPMYREQAFIAAAFHNKRMLVEHVMNGVRLRLDRCGEVYVLHRVEGQGVAELSAAPVVRAMITAGTRRTELAAAMATLGFEPTPVRDEAAHGAARVTHEQSGTVWMLPEKNADGRWELQERIAKFMDDAWCGREDNTDPVACIADGFWNLRHLRRRLRDANVLVRVQNGERSVLLARNASDAQWAAASNFLKRK